MAKPRIFISSTFYDLKQIRADLDRFIVSLGYEPVRNEEGNIPYGKDVPLEEYCYKEISNIDILVSIIGSRYGSTSSIKDSDKENSISQMELTTAIKEDKQVFIFIDKNVYTEYNTYLRNKDNPNIKYHYVDNPNIYKFIEEINSLKKNNNIKSFESVHDINNYLKEQFAGLFKQFLLDSKRNKENIIIKDIENTAKTLHNMIDYITEKNKVDVNTIININHPLTRKLKEILKIKFSIYIQDLKDIRNLLETLGYTEVNLDNDYYSWDFDLPFEDEYELKISKNLFDENKLKFIKNEDWKVDYLIYKRKEIPSTEFLSTEDLPF